jgi:arylsulfatase
VQPPEGAPNVLLVLIDDAGFGMVGECSGPFPGYNATIPRDCAPFPRMLQENGYLTAGFGKSHLTPDNQQGFSGAFDRWPTRLGFDYFRGFLGGEAGQDDPLIAENQKIIGVPEAKEGESYYFQDDLADKTIDWLHKVRSEKQKTPWFAYVATGCSHATASPS